MKRMDEQLEPIRDELMALESGEITDGQRRKLESHLDSSPSAVGAYVAHEMLAAQLELEFAQPLMDLEQAQIVEGRKELTRVSGLESQSIQPARSWLRQASRRPIPLAIAVAVAVLAALVLTMAVTPVRNWIAGGDRNDGGKLTADTTYVATLTKRHKDVWKDNSRPSLNEPRLAAGQRLMLVDGTIEISYDTGARVLLEGPADFTLGQNKAIVESGYQAAEPAKSGYLALGRLSVRVEDARGFTISTPTARVEDLGTEFAIDVHRNGSSDVLVTEGRVNCMRMLPDGTVGKRTELFAGDGALFAPNAAAKLYEASAEQVASVNARFRQSPDKGTGELVVLETFRYAPSPLPGRDGGIGWNGAWRDVFGGDENTVVVHGLTRGAIASDGNHASIGGKYHRVQRLLDVSETGRLGRSGTVEVRGGRRLVGEGKIEFSFLHRVSKVDDGFYGVELHRGPGDENRVVCIGSGAGGTGYGISSEVNGGAKRSFQSLGKEDDQVNHIVVRIRFGPGNNDVAHVYRNPTGNDLSGEPLAVFHGDLAFDRVSLGSFSGTKTHDVDQLQIRVLVTK